MTTAMNGQRPAASMQGAQDTGGGGSASLQALIRSLETVQFDGSEDVNSFCEALRALGHRLAVEASLGGIELEQVMKAQAKASGKLGIPNFDMVRSARNVAKKLNRAAAHFADGAGEAVAAWHLFEKEFEAKIHPIRNGREFKW